MSDPPKTKDTTAKNEKFENEVEAGSTNTDRDQATHEQEPKTTLDSATPLSSLSWPWSSNSSSASSEGGESLHFQKEPDAIPGTSGTNKRHTATTSEPTHKPLFSWPWSHRNSHPAEEPNKPARSASQAPVRSSHNVGGTPHAPPEEATSHHRKPLISWPWLHRDSVPKEEPKSQRTSTINTSQPSKLSHASITTQKRGTTETPLQEIMPPRKKPLFSWPWSSDKSPVDSQTPSRPSAASGIVKTQQESPSKFQNPLAKIKWPWSSSQSAPQLSTGDEEPAPSLSEPQQPKKIASQIADFARRNLPDKLLAISPWAENPEDKDKASKKREPSQGSPVVFHKPLPTLQSKLSIDQPKEKELKKVPKPKAHIPPTNKKRYSLLDEADFHPSSSASASSSFDSDDSFTLINELELLNVPIPEHLRANIRSAKSPESNWDTAYQHLAALAATDERYQAIPIHVFREMVDHPGLHSDSSGDSRVPSLVHLAYNVPDSGRDSSLPFMYGHRPFRVPKLAKLCEEHAGGSGPDIFQFDPIRVTSTEWSNIHPGSETHLAVIKWTHPEPIRADKPLLPQIDPLVKYKVKRLGKNRVTPEELLQVQKEIAVGVSPSGRKLDGYSSGSGDECVYRRVMCKNDSDFDLVQPYVETGSGDKWPHPFLHYWNWKRTDENANENYLHYQRPDKDDYLANKRKNALVLESDPTRIPYQNLGADDTDYEDPLGPLSGTPVSRVLDKLFLKSPKYLSRRGAARLGSAFGDGLDEEDLINRRYPYLLMDNYSKLYKKYYHFRLFRQAQKRRLYRACLGMLGNYTSTCATISSDPAWFYLWKNFLRRLVRRIPRRFKFCKDKDVETVFYGTFASLYATQYIIEYDLLPSMDDPVAASQMALEQALKIKEDFFTYPKSGQGAPKVDYIKLQRSKDYKNYMDSIGLLCRYQPIKMPPRVRKAFFLNYFNVLSIQTQICRIPERENMTYLWEMKNFWGKTKGLAGFMELSLEEIFHGILRCNRMHPTKQVKMFEEHPTKGLPKEMNPSRLSLDWLDPRIHFALSIGCKSCPSIHSFSLYEQDLQLDEVARTYVRSRVKVNVDFRVVTLPILFLWYEKDFGNNKFIMLWYLKQFMLSKDMLKVRQLLTSVKPIDFRYERLDYEIDHTVRRHPPTKCEPTARKKIIPLYWGSKF